MQTNHRLSPERPEFSELETQAIKEAAIDRLLCKFQKAQSAFEQLEIAHTADETKRLWLLNQVLKTMYARGHFKQAYERVLTTMLQLESTEGSIDQYATHYYKL